MIPNFIERYLEDRGIPYRVHRHRRAITAQETAHAEGVSGWRFVKCVGCEVDGRPVICAIAAPDLVDLDALSDVFASGDVRLLEESELPDVFPGCEVGAAPPLGGLFEVQVVFDRALLRASSLVMNAGTHEDLIEVPAQEYLDAERPRLASVGVLPEEHWKHAMPAAEFPEHHP